MPKPLVSVEVPPPTDVLLYEQALLSEGGQLEDPAIFVKRMNDLFVAVTGDAGQGRIILD